MNPFAYLEMAKSLSQEATFHVFHQLTVRLITSICLKPIRPLQIINCQQMCINHSNTLIEDYCCRSGASLRATPTTPHHLFSDVDSVELNFEPIFRL